MNLKIAKINNITKLISNMDIPFYRKTINSKKSLKWLQKRLPVKNSEHKNFNKVMSLIEEVLDG